VIDETERIVVWQRATAREAGDHASVAAWSRTVAARVAASGGTVLAHLSGTVVAGFPPGDVGDAVEVALDLLDEGEDAGVDVACGVSFGRVIDDGVATGAAIEAAEALAVRARPGEVLLDPGARERARGLFLFARTIGGGAQERRAASVDRTHPRRDTSTAAIARLGPIPITPVTEALLPTFCAALGDAHPALVLLRGPVGAGAVELIRAARIELAPSIVVELGGATNGVAPLASLRAALAHDPGAQMLLAPLDGLERTLLDRVLNGAFVDHDALLAALLVAVERAGGAVWFLLSPLVGVDAATLSVVLEAQNASRVIACIARVGIDTPLPPEVEATTSRVELTLPPLRTADARVVAQSVLGEATPIDVARRVAVLGGETPASVLEVARAMIGAGDLVLDSESTERRFVWRGSPRQGVQALALDAILAERLDQLDDESRRLLELVTLMPEWAPREMLDALAGADDVRARAVPRSLDRLIREGWLAPGEIPRPASSFLRRFVSSASPPARVAEVHRFVAAQIAPSNREAEECERALHLVLGGLEAEGTPGLMSAIDALIEANYAGAATQLALIVLSTNVGGEHRQRAQAIVAAHPARHVRSAEGAFTDEPSVQLQLPPEMLSPRVEPPTESIALDEVDDGDAAPPAEGSEVETFLHLELRDAIHRRDFDALDSLAERAIAMGSDMKAVARIRALAAALRGDIAGAQERLDRMRDARGPRDRRALLAEAMVALRAGRKSPAIRLGLRALADSRRTGDERGEAVALFTLAACFRAMGRPNDAALLEARVDA
jgi:hypothetical protein